MISAINNALSGLTTATKQADAAAQNIASGQKPNGDSVELSEEAVNLIVSETSYKANIATLKTINEMSDELLRVFDKTV